jgi:hypothetical protein
MTIRSPSTNEGAQFGAALAAVTTDRVLIGAPGNGADRAAWLMCMICARR